MLDCVQGLPDTTSHAEDSAIGNSPLWTVLHDVVHDNSWRIWGRRRTSLASTNKTWLGDGWAIAGRWTDGQDVRIGIFLAAMSQISLSLFGWDGAEETEKRQTIDAGIMHTVRRITRVGTRSALADPVGPVCPDKVDKMSKIATFVLIYPPHFGIIIESILINNQQRGWDRKPDPSMRQGHATYGIPDTGNGPMRRPGIF